MHLLEQELEAGIVIDDLSADCGLPLGDASAQLQSAEAERDALISQTSVSQRTLSGLCDAMPLIAALSDRTLHLPLKPPPDLPMQPLLSHYGSLGLLLLSSVNSIDFFIVGLRVPDDRPRTLLPLLPTLLPVLRAIDDTLTGRSALSLTPEGWRLEDPWAAPRDASHVLVVDRPEGNERAVSLLLAHVLRLLAEADGDGDNRPLPASVLPALLRLFQGLSNK